MPELGSYGSVRGARGTSRPYREKHVLRASISPFDPERTSCVCADAQKPASIHLQTGSLDRTFPARDLLNHIFGKVFGPAPLRCNADYADGVKPRLDPRRVHSARGFLVQLAPHVPHHPFPHATSPPHHTPPSLNTPP